MPPLPDGPAKDRLLEAIAVEGRGQRALLDGDGPAATAALTAAAAGYRASWELAGPEAYGRLVGFVKAAVLAGDDVAGEAATYVRAQEVDPARSPTATYALAVSALVLGEPLEVDLAPMHAASDAFARAADGLRALADGDREAYAAAVAAIVADFEGRDEHLTGVPIADTALLLERLAAPRGLAAGVTSPLLPR